MEEFRRGQDFVYIHLEAPDECGHRNELANKVKSISLIDELVLSPLVKELQSFGDDFSILILPDHPTPIATRTHASDPVPYLIYRSNDEKNSGVACFCEKSAEASGRYFSVGHSLMPYFLQQASF